MDAVVKREHRTRLLRASGGVLTLAVAAMGATLMYDTVIRGPEFSGGDFLLGALLCSSALVIFFLIVRPSAK